MTAQVAIDDSLFIEYFLFKNGKSTNINLIHNFLTHLKLPFVFDTSQAIRCVNILNQNLDTEDTEDIISPEIQSSFFAMGSPTTTEQDLAFISKYKVILTNNNSNINYPYLNINTPVIELNYSISCLKGENRTQLISHISELCKDADKIIIYDKYLWTNWNNGSAIDNRRLFTDIFPDKNLEIEISCGKKAINRKRSSILNIRPGKWTVESKINNYHDKNNHDRYLKIYKQNITLELILTSGFIYLWNETKEITCIIRDLS